ncbi:hypothetical protein [Evansella tamaricis]|uniref:Uncharacterized protein n=1 Tax=Evansella tamaricis TaxID=2069301 RepID=A0ABS6JMN5_9BACI|nr:hypothetical protein [Evansella tamaricis]MBU9714630.1 hypothetical protein [Evansella tamaricis]
MKENVNNSSISTLEWYQSEKHVMSLRSPYRPNHFNTINITFRQTKFPDQVKD